MQIAQVVSVSLLSNPGAALKQIRRWTFFLTMASDKRWHVQRVFTRL